MGLVLLEAWIDPIFITVLQDEHLIVTPILQKWKSRNEVHILIA